MKKYILGLALALMGYCSFSQTISITPKNFTALDEITITIDVKGNAKLESYTGDAYLWLWRAGSPDINAKTNKNPGSTIAATDGNAKFTKTGATTYVITLTPTTVFKDLAPGQIERLGIILKGNDWSDGQTSNFYVDVTPLEYIPKINRVFPSQLTSEDVITVYFDQKLAANVDVQRMKNIKVMISLLDDSNPMVVLTSTPQAQPMVSEGNGIFSYSFLANQLPPIPAGKLVSKLRYKFSGTGKNAAGADEEVITEEYEKEFTVEN